MKTLRAVIVVVLIAAAFVAGKWYAGRSADTVPAAGGRRILYWVDPMHPAYKSDKPGIAPDCGMKLEPVYADGGPAAPAAANRKILHYRDPKDPEYTSDKPGLNPETGNELQPVYEGDPASMPPGTVQISADKQQLIGVKLSTAEFSSGTDTIRAVGKVAIDETRITHVHSRTEGWIDKVYVNATGDVVRKGQPMFTIYSPELLASEQEYLLALKARDTLRGSTIRGVAADNDSLVSAARRRLELWELSETQIEELGRTQKPVTNITVYAPSSGYIMSRNAFPNQKAMPEADLYTIVDLSRVWVMASVFEYQAPQVRVGQPAVVSLPYDGGRTIRTHVSFIQPQVDPATRTIQIRLELPNPGLLLKPDMFVNVELASPQPSRLTVPAQAVLDTGTKKIVFVARGNGFFEPRDVAPGERLGDRVQVLKGLAPGEQIVTSGNFMISSESQLKSATGAGSPMPDMPDMPGTAQPKAKSQPAAPAHHDGEHPHD